MQIILDNDEAWSMMTVMTSFVIDHAGLSQNGKARLRDWRGDHAEGTPEMEDLATEINEALGGYLGDRTDRVIRRKGRYARRSAK